MIEFDDRLVELAAHLGGRPETWSAPAWYLWMVTAFYAVWWLHNESVIVAGIVGAYLVRRILTEHAHATVHLTINQIGQMNQEALGQVFAHLERGGLRAVKKDRSVH